MRLTDLDPRWFEALDRPIGVDGALIHKERSRAGFTFLCPHCQKTRLSVTTRPLKISDQFSALAALHPDSHGDIVPAKQLFAWAVEGDDFSTLSVKPSVDASASGHWHGFITDGEIR